MSFKQCLKTVNITIVSYQRISCFHQFYIQYNANVFTSQTKVKKKKQVLFTFSYSQKCFLKPAMFTSLA